jgi:phytoene dehydrogenase-like protein
MSITNETSEAPVLIVGAGMAGLSCALHLEAAGIPVRVFEASDGVGGRVRTDYVDGYQLDRGFQVYLDAYPETGKLLDLKALDLRGFEPGALVYREGQLHRLMDVFRCPSYAFSSLFAPVGTLFDKLRVGVLRFKILGSSLQAIAGREDMSTEVYLKRFGFSDEIIDRFFRSFYGGIFLERALHTSSRMFEFTFKMFTLGRATVPAQGMGAIPKQLASKLTQGTLKLESPVREVRSHSVTLSDGSEHKGRAVVLATDANTLEQLLLNWKLPKRAWRSVTNLYFSADSSPIKEAIICLNGSNAGSINNVCVLTDAAPEYAPKGKALLSVSLLGMPEMEKLVETVQKELVDWFGAEAAGWQHLRTDRIPHALPEQLPQNAPTHVDGYAQHNGVWICGDHVTSASIEGAVTSGKQLAEALISADG